MEELYFDSDDTQRMDQDEVDYIKERISQLYGPFHRDLVIQGVFFYEKRSPMMIYPAPYSQFSVAVLLPEHQADNPIARLRNLSHELVHCLMPNGPPGGQATFLEEGLAEHAAIHLTEEHFQAKFPDFNFRDLPDDDYLVAFNLVEDLARVEGIEQMRLGIRQLRANTNLPFAKINAFHLRRVFSRASTELLDALAARMIP